jgi:hypothetical protein
MKKTRKLVLSRETLHSLELRSVAGAALSYGLCTEGTGTRTTGESNSVFGCTLVTTNTVDCQSSHCSTGGACTVGC